MSDARQHRRMETIEIEHATLADRVFAEEDARCADVLGGVIVACPPVAERVMLHVTEGTTTATFEDGPVTAYRVRQTDRRTGTVRYASRPLFLPAASELRRELARRHERLAVDYDIVEVTL